MCLLFLEDFVSKDIVQDLSRLLKNYGDNVASLSNEEIKLLFFKDTYSF